MPRDPIDLVIVLAHELACSLEMNFETDEMRDLWPEALAGLASASAYLNDRGLVTPGVVTSVLEKISRQED